MRGAIRKVPMKPRFVSASTVKFRGTVYDHGWITFGDSEDLQPLLHTQGAVEFPERFVARNWLSLPSNRHGHMFPRLSSGKFIRLIVEVCRHVFGE